MNDDTLAREGLAGELGDLCILGGKDARQHLDHRHVGAQAAIEARELDADGARADDEQRFGESFGNHRLLVGPDQFSIRLEPWQRACTGAGGDDDMLGLDIWEHFAVHADHGEAALPPEPCDSFDHLDLVLAHQIGDAIGKPLSHFAAALDHARKIEAHIVRCEAELRSAPHAV